jgi:hypothetical protein
VLSSWLQQYSDASLEETQRLAKTAEGALCRCLTNQDLRVRQLQYPEVRKKAIPFMVKLLGDPGRERAKECQDTLIQTAPLD